MAKVEMVSVGPEPKTGESLKETSRFETMMNRWSGWWECELVVL